MKLLGATTYIARKWLDYFVILKKNNTFATAYEKHEVR